VPAGTTVEVPIDLCNLFDYTVNPNAIGDFRLVRELNSGNGANVELAANDPLENSFDTGDPFDIAWGSCYGDLQNQAQQKVFISQNSAGALDYDESTDEIRLRLYSDCDEDSYDVLSISVRFTNDANAVLNMNAECEFLQDTDRAIHFDGLDDRIEIDVKKQPFVFSSFTYEFWVKPERKLVVGQTQSNTIGSQSAASSSGGFPFVIFPENGSDIGSKQLSVGVAVGTDGVQVVEHYDGFYFGEDFTIGSDIIHSPVVLNHPAIITDWTHIAIVYEGRTPTLYINGENVATGLQSQFLGVHPSFQLGGGEINASANYFSGTIDDLRFWSYARSADQIDVDKTNKLSGNEPNLMALYLFDGQEPGGSNANQGLIEYAGIGSPSDAVFYNFDYGTVSSNWVHGRVAQYCASIACAPSLDLSDAQLEDFEYRSASYITSNQTVLASANVEYDAKTEINLSEGFEIEAGTVFSAFIDGCELTIPTQFAIGSISTIGAVNSPTGEGVENIIDGDIETKFLNFFKRLEFVVDLNTPQNVTTISVSTANDEPGRDPTKLYVAGSNDGTTFTDIGGLVPIDCISERFFTRYYEIENTSAYRYYKILFDSTCTSNANSMQLAEIGLWGM